MNDEHRNVARRLRLVVLYVCTFWLCAGVRAETTHTFRRAISLAPNITESIFAIGAQARLVGVSDFDHFPPQVEKIAHCGGWSNPNFEILRALNPDIIFVLGRHEKVRAFAAARGIRVEGIGVESIADIPRAMRRLGLLLGNEAGATSASLNFEGAIAGFRDALKNISPARRPQVFLCVGRQPGSLANLTTVPQWSFLSEALELAGGRNVFGDLKQYYPDISKEALIARKPDVIIELREGAPLTRAQELATAREWDALGAVPAVRQHRVYVLSAPGLLIPGPRLPETIRKLRQLLNQ